jgi:hypothetical protein
LDWGKEGLIEGRYWDWEEVQGIGRYQFALKLTPVTCNSLLLIHFNQDHVVIDEVTV